MSAHNPLDQASAGWIGFFVRHRNAANLLMVLMLMLGGYALTKLNTQFFPDINIGTISASIDWPGASAEDVETNILAAVEPAVRYLDGVDKITSYAREGNGNVVLEYKDGTDMQEAVAEVESKIAALTTLPQNAEKPKVRRIVFSETVGRIALIGPFSEESLRNYARKIRDDLLARGVDAVTFQGLRKEEFEVTIPEGALQRLGLTVREVATVIGSNTRDLPSGNLKGPVEKQIRTLGVDARPQAIGNMAIKSLPSGEKIRVQDIGKVKRTYDDDDVKGLAEGLNAIQIYVKRYASSDTLKVSKIFEDYFDEIGPTLPKTLKVIQYEGRSAALKERINLLLKNGLSGLVLVVLVLFIFLNARIAFWVAAGIPVAMMATLAIMYATGQTINMISLFALIMTLGIIVDDAIVVGEHTATRESLGDHPALAAERGAGRMITPVLAASLTTIATFTPIFLIGDTIGQIMGALPLVVIAVLVASLVECFFVLPGHLAHAGESNKPAGWPWWLHIYMALALMFILAITLMLDPMPIFLNWLEPIQNGMQFLLADVPRPAQIVLLAVASLLIVGILLRLARGSRSTANPQEKKPSAFRQGFDRAFGRFRDGPFNALVSMAYQWRYVTIALAISVALLTAGLVRGGHTGFVFFPSPEAETINADLIFTPGSREQVVLEGVAAVEASLKQVEKRLGKGQRLVVGSFSSIGQAGNNRGRNFARVNVRLVASEERDVRTPAIIKAWRRSMPKLPGLERVSILARRGGPPGRDLDIRLTGAPSAELKKAALELRDNLTAFPGLSGLADNLPYGKPEIVLSLTDRAEALGFSIQTVGDAVRNSFEGAIARRIVEQEDEIAIRVKKDQTSKEQSLADIWLKSPAGNFVPLLELVKVEERQGFAVIQRFAGKTTVSVTADVNPALTSNEVIEAELRKSFIPQLKAKYGIDVAFSGRAEERQNAFADLQLGTILALIVIYILLAWIFASYTRPFAVMAIIPFGIVGAIWGHYLMDFKLTILSMIGILGLSGILVNDSIILVGRVDERLNEGDTPRQAAIGAAKDRLRAVMLTSLTTIGGLTPLLWEQSLQAKFLQPMVITIVFGLGVATIFVLFLIPAVIGLERDIRTVLSRIYHPRNGPHLDPTSRV